MTEKSGGGCKSRSDRDAAAVVRSLPADLDLRFGVEAGATPPSSQNLNGRV
jgi:hypothetical protein